MIKIKNTYLVYGYYCHRPKFLAKFFDSDEAFQFKKSYEEKEAKNPQFEICYVEVQSWPQNIKSYTYSKTNGKRPMQ